MILLLTDEMKRQWGKHPEGFFVSRFDGSWTLERALRHGEQLVPRPRAVFGRYPRRELLQSAEASNCVGTGSLREQRGSFRRSLSQSHRESSPDIIPLLLPTAPDLQVNQSLSRSSCVHPPMKPALDSLATRNGFLRLSTYYPTTGTESENDSLRADDHPGTVWCRTSHLPYCIL